MPELRWAYGYPFALGLMLLTCAGLFLPFTVLGRDSDRDSPTPTTAS